ncbi:uncharacterized protein LOC131699232 [Acipenser ruthenus]|uniref:uncharacterized protein LOC131699232 n=1 Tax=Acipenser ruthenus TaxID=7906 RepID=UPI0027417BE3|nr:uncharacterized protein LOC131699232 [Acipenser ruthenus]XP_058851641.1 uncharacterized protein LOC131699232 [Acipenser ruthenus]
MQENKDIHNRKKDARLNAPYKRFLDPDFQECSLPKTSRWRIKLSHHDHCEININSDNRGTDTDENISMDDNGQGEIQYNDKEHRFCSDNESNHDELFIRINEDSHDSDEEDILNNVYYTGGQESGLGQSFNNCSNDSEQGSSWNFEDNLGDENDFEGASGIEFMKQVLFSGSELTVAQSAVLILSYALRYSLPASALEDLLRLISLHLPNNNLIPQSLFMFKKMFKNPSDALNIHFYCKTCKAYVPSESAQCCECNEEWNREGSMREGHFFVSLSLKEQIANILEKEECVKSDGGERNAAKGDTYNGAYYKSIPQFTESDISLLWNCDGVPAFKSSAYSLWPIRCVINELPPTIRFKVWKRED